MDDKDEPDTIILSTQYLSVAVLFWTAVVLYSQVCHRIYVVCSPSPAGHHNPEFYSLENGMHGSSHGLRHEPQVTLVSFLPSDAERDVRIGNMLNPTSSA